MAIATIQDINILFRELEETEKAKAEKLLDIVEDLLRQEAMNVGKDLDCMINEGTVLENTVISVIVDIVARTLMTSTNQEPMTQYSQSALGYTVSGSFLSPGGGIFIKEKELARLGLRKQKIGVIDLC